MFQTNRFQPSYGYGADMYPSMESFMSSTPSTTTTADTSTTAAPTTKKGFRMTEAQGTQLISTSGDVAKAIIGATTDVKIARITKKDPRKKGSGGGGEYTAASGGSAIPWGTIGLAVGGLLLVGTVIFVATKK